MPIRDKQGRPYAKLSDLQSGHTVEVDGDFTCMPPWTAHKVKQDGAGLYLECKDGKHHLHGQADDGEHCVGVYQASGPTESI